MPPLARRYLKTAVTFLVVGVLTGLHMSSAQHLDAGRMHALYLSAHAHVLLVGFVVMGAMAAGLWLLPEAPAGSRYREGRAAFCWWLLVVGTAGRYLGESALGYVPRSEWLRVAVFLISGAQALGILFFAWNVWPRIRA